MGQKKVIIVVKSTINHEFIVCTNENPNLCYKNKDKNAAIAELKRNNPTYETAQITGVFGYPE